VNEISKASSDAKVEVVMYGQGVHMVKQGGSPVEPMILKALQNKNVSFKVCAVALKNQGIAEDQLLPGVGTVPDGIYEIILKQKEGWGYIKAVH
jgi:intracellular sulfur oxidation DsrE/DsrF family protein